MLQEGLSEYGNNSMSISKCVNHGNVETSGSAPAGGIVGAYAATIDNCVNIADISAGYEAGGIAGIASSISRCYSQGDIKGGTSKCAGGIAGSGTSVEFCFSNANVEGRYAWRNSWGWVCYRFLCN